MTSPVRGSSLAVGLAAAGGALTFARPTGSVAADLVWCAALAALGAVLASHAAREPLVVAAGVVALVAPQRSSLLIAALGLAAAIASADGADRARARVAFLRGVAGGAAVCALLLGSPVDRPSLVAAAGWVAVALLVAGSAGRRMPRPMRRRLSVAVGSVGGVAIALSVVAAVAAASARHQADRGANALQQGLEAAHAGDVAEARRQLQVASSELDSAADTMGTWGGPARGVPGTAQNVRLVTTVLADASVAARRAEGAAVLVDSDALTVERGRVDLGMVASLERPLTALAGSLRDLIDDVDRLDQGPVAPQVRRRLRLLLPDARRGLRDAETGSEAARVVPQMLGRDGTRRYLVLFTSPAEARGRFGFPGSYGILTADRGRLDLEVAEGIGAIQAPWESATGPMPSDEAQVAPYVTYGATRNWRSVTIPPDFPTVAALARGLWNETGTGRIDGVLRLDTTALAALARLSGPVEVEGRPGQLTAETITRYLDFDQYLEFADDPAPERRAVLERLARAIFDRLTEEDLPGPRRLADVLGPMVEQGHLQLVTYDDREVALLDEMGTTGRFGPPSTPDALLVAGTNITGNKIDTFLRREVTYRATIGPSAIRATATIAVENTAPASGLPDYVIGSARSTDVPPRGSNRMVVMVWSPRPVERVTIDGIAAASASNHAGAWWFHAIELEVPAGSTRTVELELVGRPATPGPYRLTVLPAVGATPDQVRVAATSDREGPLIDRRARVRRAIVFRANVPS